MSNTDEEATLPTLREITPNKFRCSVGGCPSVFENTDGSIVIIGKKPSEQIASQIKHKIADDEWAVVIDRELLAEVG